MRLSRRDTMGLLLVGGTLTVLLVHGEDFHQDSHDPEGTSSTVVEGGRESTAPAEPAVVAFVDVNIVPHGRDAVLANQVVIVRDGVVTRVGRVGELDAPTDARIVHGHGSAYLVPGFIEALGDSYGGDGRPAMGAGNIEAGAPAELLLVEDDPRVAPRTVHRPRGAIAKGAWYDRDALSRMLSEGGG